ncbi:MAG: hypothetical protein AAGD32_01860 [Planctomycetota bacterium]
MSRVPPSDPAKTSVTSTDEQAMDAEVGAKPTTESAVDDDGDVIHFDCVEAHTCAETLLDHCKRVVTESSRIEMRLKDGSRVVLISKCELDSLEEALDMYGCMNEGEALHARVRGIADCIQKEMLTDGPRKSDGEAN